MTTSRDGALPFVLTYAERIERDRAVLPVRYDRSRQLSQVRTTSGWIDAVEGTGPRGGTRITRVDNETTDDD